MNNKKPIINQQAFMILLICISFIFCLLGGYIFGYSQGKTECTQEVIKLSAKVESMKDWFN